MSRTMLRALTAVIVLVGCRNTPPPGGRAPDAGASAAPPARDDHGAHEHGQPAAKQSDLDRPVDALFAESCEHGKKTFECDECRYQVGVVRVPKDLRDGGLVKTTTVARRRLELGLPLTGEISFDDRLVTHLAPTVEARVRRVHASLGQRVRAGDPLVELESVALGEAVSQYREALATLGLTRRSAERADALREEKIASEKEWLQARQDREAAEIRARAAEEKLHRLGLTGAEVEAAGGRGQPSGRGMLTLRAPAAGVVLEMHAVPGELVRPDPSILTVGDLSRLWLWADLYEDQLAAVLAHDRSRLRAGVSVKAFPGEVFPGTVDFVGPTMNEKTRTVKVRIALDNAAGKLRAGMFAAVQLYLPGTDEGLAVPRGAVLTDEGRSFVFLHHHGEWFVRRPVEAARASVDWIEIRRGLVGGETVAVDGAFLMKSDVLRSKMGAGCAD